MRRADEHERSILDFKETPDTALTAAQKQTRNIGKARKEFLAQVAGTAACLANAQGGTIVIGVRDSAATREEAIQGVGDAYTSARRAGSTTGVPDWLISGRRPFPPELSPRLLSG